MFALFTIVVFVGAMLYLARGPMKKLLGEDIRVEFRELDMTEEDDLEVGPGILLVKRSKLEERFVINSLTDSETDSEEEST